MAAEPSSAPRPKRTASSSADVVDDDTYRDAPSGNNKRAHLDNDAEEAMTRDEIEGAELPPTEPESASSQPSTKPRNACKIYLYTSLLHLHTRTLYVYVTTLFTINFS